MVHTNSTVLFPVALLFYLCFQSLSAQHQKFCVISKRVYKEIITIYVLLTHSNILFLKESGLKKGRKKGKEMLALMGQYLLLSSFLASLWRNYGGINASEAVLVQSANPLQLFFSFCLNEKFVALFSKSIEFFFPGSLDPYDGSQKNLS